MNLMWLEQVVYVIVLIGLVPLFHELGHALYLTEALKKKVRFEQNWKRLKFAVIWEDDGKLKKSQYFDIASWGIIAGTFPFLLLSSGLDIRFFIPMFVVYFIMSCRHDWVEIYGLFKK